MKKQLTAVLVKKLLTFALGGCLVGFVTTLHQVEERLTLAQRQLVERDRVIRTLSAKDLDQIRAVAQVRDILEKIEPVQVTAYSNQPEQTDDRPDECAWGNRFSEYVRGHKTIAVSRDFLEKGWRLGDVVYVKGIGKCIVWDVMGKRWRNKIDVALNDPSRFSNFQSIAVRLGDVEG